MLLEEMTWEEVNYLDRSTVVVAPFGAVEQRIPVGLVGLGLMGTSIATCLLAAGHRVAGVEADPSRRGAAARRVRELLREMKSEGLLKTDPAQVIKGLAVSADYTAVANSRFVIESITESIQAKRQVLRCLEEIVSPETLIGTNTSAIPVTDLQQGTLHPERIVGIHWAEPAHVTRFMEIICGKETLPANAQYAMALARRWGKEPSLLRRDVRGFLMYAMLREAFYLVESGFATPADIDRSLRNDVGYWITFAGPYGSHRDPRLCRRDARSASGPELREGGSRAHAVCRRVRGSWHFQLQGLLSLHARPGPPLGTPVSQVQLRGPRAGAEIFRPDAGDRV